MCEEAETLTERIPEPPPAELEPPVRECQRNLKACLKVCEALQTAAGGAGPITRCMVTHDPTGHDVTVGFTPPCSE